MFGGEESEKKVKVLSGGERSRLAMTKLLLEPVNLLILDEPTNHLDMQSKDVLKEAVKAFDGTAIIVSHDREFLDGLVTKVYEFGGGRVVEHLGGIYDFLRRKNIESFRELEMSAATEASKNEPDDTSVNMHRKQESMKTPAMTSSGKASFLEQREQQKKIRRLEKSIKEAEDKISTLENRIKELDEVLCTPEGASDMTVVTEYTSIKKLIDQETDRWEQLCEELEEQQK